MADVRALRETWAGAAGRQGRAGRRTTPGRWSTPAPTPSSCPTTAAASSTGPRRRWSSCPPSSQAVGDRAEVYLDGGILDGADVVAAVALGARACLVGRAYLYGLMAGGERGRAAGRRHPAPARSTRTMQLLGVTSVAELTPDRVRLRSTEVIARRDLRFLGCAMDVVEVVPTFEQYAFTFGGVAPIRRVAPGTALRLWSEDAFCGALQSTKDLSSEKVDLRFVNPQTGPFYVEGAEPGDTLALHFVELEPGPRLGRLGDDPVLRRPDQHRPHRHPAGPAAGHHLDLRAGPGAQHRRVRRPAQRPADRAADRADAGHGRRRPGRAARSAARWCRSASAATWTPRRCGPAPPASSASTSRARCSRSATATTGRARARPAAPPSRAR